MINTDPKNMTFLIVDDMENMRRSIRAMLKIVGYGKNFHEAENGKKAWELLTSGIAFDFIISDFNMPKMTGTELLSMMRSSKKHRDIPFLMITADANQSIVAEAAEQDVDAYLTKPFVTATLEQKIKELIHFTLNPSKLTLLLNKAAAWREKGEVDKAIECARMAAELNKRSSRPLRELGRLYLKKDDIPLATKCFEKALSLNRLDVPSYHYLGQINLKLGHTEKAITHFTKALELSPRHADRAFKVATLLMKKNKPDEAAKIIKVMLKNNPNNIDLHEDVADSCFDSGMNALAAKYYQYVLSECPDREYLLKKLGTAHLRHHDPQSAIEIFERAIMKTPEDIDMLLDLAQAYLDSKLRMRADKWASKAARIDPANVRAKELLKQCE
nr:tetratricopeptide repeat protein [Desulfobulbaceae bacterium]